MHESTRNRALADANRIARDPVAWGKGSAAHQSPCRRRPEGLTRAPTPMIDAAHPLLLGSASPRRREILATLRLPLRVAAADVDETAHEGEAALDYVARIADAKLAAVTRLPETRDAGAVLVADTTVVLEGRPLGKPGDEHEARTMLRALAGRAHHVSTRFVIAGGDDPGRARHAETVTSEVVFRALDEEEIALYAATGEGLDKAGAYAIQGIGSFAVARIEGSYTNVVGLPACEVVAALRATGLLARFPLPRA
jgi:septum formation protein